MIIAITVSPRSSKNQIIPLRDGSFKARLTAAPVDNKANAALIKLLSEHFKVAKSQVEIVSGQRARKKIIEIS